MDLRAALQPRDPQVASRTAAAFLLVGALAVAVQAVVGPRPDDHAGVVEWVVVVVLVLFAGLLRRLPAQSLSRLGVWAVAPVVGVLAVSGLNLLTADSSSGAQAFLTLPVLYAACQLLAPVAAAVTGLALVTEATVLFSLERPAVAAIDLMFIGALLVLTTVLLVRAGDRQARLVATLEQQAAVDALTGLVTRRVLDNALSSALSAGATSEGTALILIDVDAFKSINDAHGHPVGDEALVHLAGVLSASVRATDAVVSRIGGDELAVVLPGCSIDVAVRRAEELVAVVRASPMRLGDGTGLAMSISVGVAHAPGHAAELRHLYVAADAALYEAKRAGRNRVSVAAPAG
jgi:diguanylate cyclase (GGDEF)-like protein